MLKIMALKVIAWIVIYGGIYGFLLMILNGLIGMTNIIKYVIQKRLENQEKKWETVKLANPILFDEMHLFNNNKRICGDCDRKNGRA